MKELTDKALDLILMRTNSGTLSLMRAVIAADRALNAPAEQSTAREQDMAMFIRRIVSMVHRECEDDSNLLTLANEAWYYLARNNLLSAPFRDADMGALQGPAAWVDEFGNVFPLGAYRPNGKPSWTDAHKRGWKPLYTHPAPNILAALRAKVAKIQAIGENQRYFQAVVLDLIDKMERKI